MSQPTRSQSITMAAGTGPSRVGGIPRVAGDAAADAAAAAEFAAKKWVWIPDKEAGYLQAWVVSEDQEAEMSQCSLQDGQMRTVAVDDLSKMNPPKFDKAEDIADLTFLNEASVVHNLRQRYFSGLIYTYSGLFLVAVNPYHALPIYTDAIVAAYKGRRREENAPHVFALADGAMRNMLEARENQSLLITGESGAGKTENTKKVIQYLAAVAVDPANGNDGSAPALTRSTSSSRSIMDHLRGVEGIATKRLGLLERQILQANPILEAFGNAQTIRNNNSSRFGKFVRIEFTSAGAIAGANIDWYLLEKSRVTTRSEKERSFHIFYQLLRGADSGLKSKLLLGKSPEEYDYLKNTRKHVEGVNDEEEWKILLEALDTVGFSVEERENLFRVVAAILQVGNIQLADDRSEQARITNTAQVEKVCHVLGLPQKELDTALLRPRVKAGREWVTQARTRRQVIDEMAALCKTLYEKTFASIVDRINRALDRPTSKSTFIGVLDIAGFEIFETNSFEQLCINFTNEKLQQFFNHHMFVLEQEEYARENIEWDFVNFGLDLQPTIDLIESTNPIGILSCLDEECIMPKATDLTFTEKLTATWSTNKDGTARDAAGLAIAKEKGIAHGSTKFGTTRFAQGFIVKHYAGDVEYRTDGWLEKNKDPLNDNLTRVLSESSDSFIASLFAEYSAEDSTGSQLGPRRRAKRGAFRTVAQRHKEQLSSLMSQLSSTQPHFVRCIVPNPEKKPGKINVPLVLEQLRCNGVLEGIRIARLGYPNRLLFTEFRTRYEVLTPGIIPRGYMDGRKACQRMVEALDIDRSVFKIGLTKIFFKSGVLADLEERRDRHLHDIFARFQAACRMFTARRQMKKILNRAAAVRMIQRNARLYVQLREWPWWQLYTRVRPLLKATRHDEELKRKQAELALVTERAERDQKEREALEKLRFSLESEKKKVEAELENERALLVDKDELLARSKERESALEEDIAAMQADIDQLDSQLERAIAGQRAAEQSRDELKVAFDQAADHLVRLESEQKAWKEQETSLLSDVGKRRDDVDRMTAERKSLQSEKSELARQLADKGQDLERAQKRMKETVADLERKLESETRERQSHATKVTELEAAARQSTQQYNELSRSSKDRDEHIKAKDAEIERIEGKIKTIASERDNLAKEMREAQAKIETLSGDLQAAKAEQNRAGEQQAALQRELQETRQLVQDKSSEDSKQKELQRMQEQEIASLRKQISALSEELTQTKHSSLAELNAARLDAETAKKEHADLRTTYDSLKREAKANEAHLSEVQTALATAERDHREAEGNLKAVREQLTGQQRLIEEAQNAKADIERQLTVSQEKQQHLEDSFVELERNQAVWKAKIDQLNTELSAESKRRELADSAAKKHQGNVSMLEQQHSVKDKEIAAMKQELAATTADLKKAQSMTNKTIVEHVHVLEEAKKYTDRQLQEAQGKLQELAHYTKTLEKSKARLISENEDLTRDNTRLQQEARSGSRGILTSMNDNAPSGAANADAKNSKALLSKVGELENALRTARNERDEAQSNARRKDLQMEETLSRTRAQYEVRITELERELRGSQTARSTAVQSLAELVENSSSGGGDDGLRHRLLEQLRMDNDELEVEISAKADMLRSHKMINGPTNGRGDQSFNAFSNLSPNKRNSVVTPSDLRKAGALEQQNGMRSLQSSPRIADNISSDRRLSDLQKQVNTLQAQKRAGMRVRQHLELSMKDLADAMNGPSGNASSLDAVKRLFQERNQQLQSLLREEKGQGDSSNDSPLRKEYSEKVPTPSSFGRSGSPSKESSEALHSMRQSYGKLEAQHAEVRQRLEREVIARNEATSEKRRLQTTLQELQINEASLNHAVADARDALRHQKQKADRLQAQLESLEMEKLKAQKAEDVAKMGQTEAERALEESMRDRRMCEEQIEQLEKALQEATTHLRQNGKSWNDIESLRKRLAQDFESDRRRYKEEIRQREDIIESSRRNFKQEIDAVAAEIDAHRAAVAQLRSENRELRNMCDELSVSAKDGNASKQAPKGSGGSDEALVQAYKDTMEAQREAQSQISSLLEHIRDQRLAFDETEMKYGQLAAQYNALTSQRGVDEQVVRQLEDTVQRFRAQAQAHLDEYKRSAGNSSPSSASQAHSLRSPTSPSHRLDSQSSNGNPSPTRKGLRAM